MTFAGDVSTTIVASGSGSLTLDNGSSGSSPATIKAAGSHAINVPFSLNTDAAINVTESDGVLTLGGVVSGEYGIIKTGIGTLSLTQSNTYSGATSLNAGTLTLSGSAGALANTSGITLNGGTLLLQNAAGQGSLPRVPPVPISANGGGITYTNAVSAGSSYTQTLGTLTIAAGQTTITSTNEQGSSDTSVLTLGGLSQSGTVVRPDWPRHGRFPGPNLGVNGTRNSIQITGQAAYCLGPARSSAPGPPPAARRSPITPFMATTASRRPISPPARKTPGSTVRHGQLHDECQCAIVRRATQSIPCGTAIRGPRSWI